ncbi:MULTISPECIES: phage late control D family protein [Pseudomonas]|uniref:phage late control D family protein n=1 Tax=Pseudomonas TaxID=286 RepID=UPI0022646C74|nr:MULTISPECIES: contractile injection system protein, VgrG/Pvc8 family [Pseudomonas]MDC7818882.1 contractile injection system protein, VgrG/Pvc8 family [Pseudomonas sp. BLCC-B112]
MSPMFRIVAEGKNITALINDRLLSLRTSDKPGMGSDEFELRIDDRDSVVALPSRGTSIEVFMGYADQSLTRLGRYMVDEVVVMGSPDSIENRGKASDMRGSGKTTRRGSWENVPLQQILRDVAACNGWQPVCPVTTKVPRVDQLNESDFNFITRLAKQYDCTAKVADGKLLVLPRQAGQSASGKALGAVTITRHIYPNKSAAEQAAKARLAAFNRSTASVRLEMPGRTDLFAERMINAQGFKLGLDGEYLVDSVEQVSTQSGWSTAMRCISVD